LEVVLPSLMEGKAPHAHAQEMPLLHVLEVVATQLVALPPACSPLKTFGVSLARQLALQDVTRYVLARSHDHDSLDLHLVVCSALARQHSMFRLRYSQSNNSRILLLTVLVSLNPPRSKSAAPQLLSEDKHI